MPHREIGTCEWVCHDPRPDATLRLFAFPYAGGSAQIYRTWPAGLPHSVELFALQLPGRGRRLSERPFDRLVPLVEAVADLIRPLLDRPFAFYGHSMGALVGFELARELRRRGQPPPTHLFVSGCVAPQYPDPFPTLHLSDGEFLRALRKFNGIPDEVLQNLELLELVLPAVRADCALTETYVYAIEPPLEIALSAFGGVADPLVKHSDLEGWRGHTSQSFALRMFPGHHFFIDSARPLLLDVVARTLCAPTRSPASTPDTRHHAV